MAPSGNTNHNSKVQDAKAYSRLKRRFSYIEFCIGVLFLAALVSGPTFLLRDLVFKIPGGPVMWVLAYFILGAVLYEIVTLPLNILSGYYIERKFGLLNQSAWSWAKDLMKAQVVSLVLGAAAVEILYVFFRWVGTMWWLPAGAAFALIFVVLSHLAPVVLLPLFFSFREMPESDLTRGLITLCDKAGAGVNGIYEWGLSTKTKKANAALVGWGSTRRVVLADSLLENFTPSEIEVVLAHELGHHVLKHMPKLLVVQALVTVLAFFFANLVFQHLGPVFGFEYIHDVAGLPLLLLSFVGVGLVVMPLVNWISRRYERRADRFALEMTGLVGSLISAMERLAAMNLSELEPHPLVEALFHSHPSPASRIRDAKAYMDLPGGRDHEVR